MADIAVVVQQITDAGITPAYAGSLVIANTYQVVNDGRVFLHVKNGGGTICNVTIDTPGTVGGLAVAQRTFAVPITTGEIMDGPYPPSIYNQPGTNYMNVTFDFITSVTFGAFRL